MRLSLKVLMIAAALAALPSLLRADDRTGLVWMSGDAIRAEFAGQPLAGIYPSTNPWTEMIHTNGTSDYREGQKHWTGRWWIENREFCFHYPPPGLGGCFRIVRISANCFELYDFSGTLGRAEEPPNIANKWNGQMWRTDRTTTCEARPSV